MQSAESLRIFRETPFDHTNWVSRGRQLTRGPFNETYFEHAYIARYLGFTLVVRLHGEGDAWRETIRVNAVCPGMIQTLMSDKMIAEGKAKSWMRKLKTYVPMKRLGRREEIADPVLWLCSSTASYVTGQSISIDGG
ncbi:MAG TPA: SDR family oxidoreductase [Edaphobacter sp.]|nr:SDR family oxidoreductase [Edaphobacter sp.]